MTAILFVHGTSVRRQAYEASLDLFRKRLYEKVAPAQVEVAPCLWGDSLGVRLNAGGKSVPEFKRNAGAMDAAARAKEDRAALWEMLAYDSLFELRGLALRRRVNAVNFQAFNARADKLPSDALKEVLRAAGIDGTFVKARDYVQHASDYQNAIASEANEANLADPVARAIVAEAMAQAEAVTEGDDARPSLFTDAGLRDAAWAAVSKEILPQALGIADWAKNLLFGAAKQRLTSTIRHRRTEVTKAVAPFIGDILLYQARGDEIREFVRHKIETVAQGASSVVVVGHSLGGIACVELLLEQQIAPVTALITAGSQSPFFYELGALRGLKYGEPLPDHFPKWVNLYDPRDILSYVGQEVFPPRPDGTPGVRDVEVNNGLPFPDSHSGYWANPETWLVIQGALP